MHLGRINRLYEGLTAQQRVSLIYLAIIEERLTDPGIRGTAPPAQTQEIVRLLDLGMVLHGFLGPIATELGHRVQACSLRYLLAHELTMKNALLDLALSQNFRKGESTPESDRTKNVESQFIPDDRDAAESLVEVVSEELPRIHDELLALESEFRRILAELGVSDHPAPHIEEMIAYGQEDLELVRNALNFAFDLEVSFGDAPSLEMVEALRRTIGVSHAPNGSRNRRSWVWPTES